MITVASRYNNHDLQVTNDGKCLFKPTMDGWHQDFRIKPADGANNFYVVCASTGNVLSCDKRGFVFCNAKNQNEGELWTAVYPKDSEVIASDGIIKISISTVLGAFAIPAMGLGPQSLVCRVLEQVRPELVPCMLLPGKVGLQQFCDLFLPNCSL